MQYEIIDVSTKSPDGSMCYVDALEHVVTVDDGSEWVEVSVKSRYDGDGVYLTVDDARFAALASSFELRDDCAGEWQTRFEMEACDGPN